MISSLTNEKKYGDLSASDFTTLGVEVVPNSTDHATANTQFAANTVKPTIANVISQIDVKNTALWITQTELRRITPRR